MVIVLFYMNLNAIWSEFIVGWKTTQQTRITIPLSSQSNCLIKNEYATYELASNPMLTHDIWVTQPSEKGCVTQYRQVGEASRGQSSPELSHQCFCAVNPLSIILRLDYMDVLHLSTVSFFVHMPRGQCSSHNPHCMWQTAVLPLLLSLPRVRRTVPTVWVRIIFLC